MPPTFLILLGFIVYFAVIAITLFIGGILILFKSQRSNAKILIFTILISYPTFLIVGAAMAILFAIPAFGIMFLLQKFGNPDIFGYLALFALLIIIIAALYHWYLGFILIKNGVLKRKIDQSIENNKVYSIFLKRIVEFIVVSIRIKNSN
jgi:hypothetical protein